MVAASGMCLLMIAAVLTVALLRRVPEVAQPAAPAEAERATIDA